MKRQIELRAFHKPTKTMLNLRPLEIGMAEGYHICFGCEEYRHEFYGSEFHNPDDWEVMQFTGLYDKNGKEIYEGDIVRTHPIPRDINPIRERCIVVWGLGFGGYGLQVNGEWCTYSIDDSTEVIGNIYENPEKCGELIAGL